MVSLCPPPAQDQALEPSECVCASVCWCRGGHFHSSSSSLFFSSQCLFSGRPLDKALIAHQPYEHLNNGTWREAALQVHSHGTSFFSSRPSPFHPWAFARAVRSCSLSGSSASSFSSQLTYHLFRPSLTFLLEIRHLRCPLLSS